VDGPSDQAAMRTGMAGLPPGAERSARRDSDLELRGKDGKSFSASCNGEPPRPEPPADVRVAEAMHHRWAI